MAQEIAGSLLSWCAEDCRSVEVASPTEEPIVPAFP